VTSELPLLAFADVGRCSRERLDHAGSCRGSRVGRRLARRSLGAD
jgi:hypothetical protein